jgi:hypothetical protein
MRRRATAVHALALVLLSCEWAPADFLPDADGWIRHWIIYGPIGHFGDPVENKLYVLHPVTLEPIVLSDLIAEEEGKPGRWTERNFLPAPGREIDTAFRTVVPEQILRPEARVGINPNGKPMGVGWVACHCGDVNIDEAFDFPSSENDGPGGDFSRDVRHYVAYAYTYVENLTSDPITAYPIFDPGPSDYTVHLLFGSLPTKIGETFLSTVYAAEGFVPIYDLTCGHTDVPFEDGSSGRYESKKIILEPGMNLFLYKHYAGIYEDMRSLRLRATTPPYPPITEGIRIRFYPDPNRPDPVLFKRMDADGNGLFEISDVVRIIDALFLSGAPLGCPDAADVNDDGHVDVSDPLRALGILFLGEERQPFPRYCCGLDPTEDDLPDCTPESVKC